MKILKLFSTVIHRSGYLILSLGVLGLVIQQVLIQQVQNQISSPDGSSQALLFGYGFLLILIGFLHPGILFFLICRSQSHESLRTFFSRTFEQVVIEMTRSTGKVITWSLLLLIPGLIKMLRLSFVPFIVCLDPDYQKGQKDALQESEKIAKPMIWTLAGIYLLFELAIPLTMSIWEEYQIIWQTPVSAFILLSVEVLFTTLMMTWLMSLFLTATQTVSRQSLSSN